LVEAEGQASVDPLKLLEGATVRVCYDGMLSTDRIALFWQTAPGEYAPIEPQYGVDEGCIEFQVLPFFVGLLLDNFAVFYYTVHRDGEDYKSLPTSVRISRPSNLTAPTFMGASDGDVDLSLSCCRDPIVRVERWPFIDRVQTVRLHVIGTHNDGTGFSKWYFDGENLTEQDVANGWSRPLPFATLSQLKHGSKLVLVFFVKFHGTDSGHSILFPDSAFTLRTEPHLDPLPPKLREAVETEFGDWIVNPTNTVDGAHIEIAYEGICSKDLVCPTFSGTPGDGSPPLECRTVGEGANSVVVPVPPSAISANFEKDIKLAYKVTRCDGSQWSSPEQTVKVLGFTGLPKPYIEQVTGRVLDLGTFNDDATVVVPIWGYAAVGQCVWVWITGTLEAGSSYLFYILMGKPLKTINDVDAPITRAELKKLEDCSDFELHAAVNFDGKCDLASAHEFPVQTFKIEQEPLVLLEPKVTEAVGQNLTADNGRNGVHVEVDYVGNNLKHSISVCWKRPNGSCWPLTPKPGSTTGAVIWLLPPEAVIESMGKVVEITYTVTTACKVQTSPPLNLNVSLPVRLEAPNVLEATPPNAQNAVLDLRTFTGNAKSLVDPKWFLRAGQTCWLRVDGTDKNGIAYWFNVYSARTITAPEETAGIAGSVLRSELEKAKDQSLMSFKFSVVTDGSELESNAIEFPKLNLTLKKKYRDLTEFDHNTLEPWKKGAGVGDPRDLSIEQISGPDGKLVHAVKNFTYSNNSAGPILQRTFNDLENGHIYRFSVQVRQYGFNAPAPQLSLSKDGVRQTPILTFTDLAWHTLAFTFVAGTAGVLLAIDSHVATGLGNDWYMTAFLIEEV
jgi:hypothetical protein